MRWKSYLIVIILAILFGIFSEIVVSQKEIDGTIVQNIFKVLFLNVYVYALLIITIIFELMGSNNFKTLTSSVIGNLLLFIFLFVIISILECIFGKISNVYHNGHQTWKYSPKMIPFCNGYVSVVTSLYFTIFIFLYIRFIYPILFL